MKRVPINVAPAIAAMLLFLGATPIVLAQTDTESTTHSGVVIAKQDDSLSVWTEGGRLVFDLSPTTTMPKRDVGTGNLVVVRETKAGSGIAENVILVDQEVWVAGSGSNERALIGRAEPSVTGPTQLIVRTADGQEMFVIDPKTFHQPLPERGQRVALTYRVVDVNPPRYMATGLVLLPDSFEDSSPVKITYSDTVLPAEKATAPVVATKPAAKPLVAPAPTPAPLPAPEPQPMLTLPRTAGRTPAVALLGLMLVSTGLAVKFSA